MSQLPNPPEPDRSIPLPTSEVSPPSPQAATKAATQSQQLLQQLQQLWRQTQPVLKSGSIQVLRLTIQVLEFALKKLEASPQPSVLASPAAEIKSSEVSTPTAKLVSPEAVTLPAATTQQTAARQTTARQTTARQTTARQTAPIPPSIPVPKPEILEKAQAWWATALVRIRSLLPIAWNENLSDSALTSIVAGGLVLLVWVTPALLPGKSPEVASKPVAQPVSEQPVESPTPQIPPPSISPPALQPPAPPELSAPEPERPIAITPPASPPAARLTPSVTETKLPPPPLNLTPEQSLIAAIENQVAEVTREYADGLIESIQANFRSSRLTVKISDGWYDLPQPRQDRLAIEMLKRSKELDFSALELIDRQGTLLARSPVVGTEMVILQRNASTPLIPHSG